MRKILLVDDNPINLKMIDEMINLLGYDTDLATNGRDAVDMFEQGKYDLVLLDIMMPEMDGIEALKLIKQKDLSAIVYAVTANIFFEQVEEYRGIGFDGIITKPITLSELNNKIKNSVSH